MLWHSPPLSLWRFWPAPPSSRRRSLFQNLSETTDRALNLGDIDVGGGDRFGVDGAQSFTTGSAADFLSVTLSMAAGLGVGTFVVQLWSDASGSPGSSLLTLTGEDDSTAAGPHIYTAPTLFALDASTPYWIVATVTHSAPDKLFSWNATASGNEAGGAGWSLGNNVMSRVVNNGIADPWQADTFAAQMSVEITAVPEAATFWPLIGFLSVFALIRGMVFVCKRRNHRFQNSTTDRWSPASSRAAREPSSYLDLKRHRLS